MKRIYFFEEGDGTNKDLLGGKGAGLCTMTQLGLPVPPGFIITTEVCREYYRLGKLPEGLMDEVRDAMRKLQEKTGKRFGDPNNPLLVSVRSGSKYSMPGMMDTILNLGMNDSIAEGLAKLTGDERFALDAYRRFLQMFGKIVLGIKGEKFEEVFEKKKKEVGAKHDIELGPKELREIVEEFKEIIRREKGEFPQDPFKQLEMAIEAVFKSWNNPRAIEYRNFYKIPHDLGTAVNVVTMVFGNVGENSGTGVVFTRNPSTGEKELYGEFLFRAQGEDVVAGIRTPLKIQELKQRHPEIYHQLEEVAEKLERHYKDMQDMEFTVENGKLYMLQTRAGKRTALAAVKIAVDMCKEGLITKEEAILRIEPSQVEQLLHPQVDPNAKVRVIARGINASPGAAVGKVVFDSKKAKELGEKEKVILVRPETSPDDVGGMIAAQGVLTSRGGATSHAAVVARGLGKPAVVGCEELDIDLEKGEVRAPGGIVIREGDIITIDGTKGEVILGEAPLIEPKIGGELMELLSWCDEVKRLQNWANADYPEDARKAREFGAQGIGLCRTERMFRGDRLPLVQKLIMAESREEREELCRKLARIQKEDFKEIFKVMDGLPVVVRLLDPPLHEFLPPYETLLKETLELKYRGGDPKVLAEKEWLLKRVEAMREANPMIGLRGVRLGILRPEIYRMQVRAILEAACELKREGYNPIVKIMIPNVGHVNELKIMKELVDSVAKEVFEQTGVSVDYKFGTMIEQPRAALTADELAKYAEFFSFGTNDLTQSVFAYSRDDVERTFLFTYLEQKILESNPFQTLDREGVGKIMRIAVELGRKTRPDLEIGICGEHGGDPASIEFCHEIGLDYVSCSPFRIPVGRLAAAHASLKEKRREISKAYL